MNQLPLQLPDLDYAPKWQRLIHFTVDTVLGLVLGAALLPFMLHGLPDAWLEAMLEWPEKWLDRTLRWGCLLFYYLAMEVTFRTTPGKWITRARVTDAEGREPSRNRLLLRTFCRFIPADALSFFGRDGTGWHDAVSKTYVVRRQPS